ncbi:MAG: ATP-binding protein, partial [Candidatus Marinimicrobia bacterium]|nr:ATP-binding protein [Candidatus Neomarinimicrobiota bacterium]
MLKNVSGLNSIADLPKVEGDTGMMRQVWMNLISNTVKFSSKRKQVVIIVSCKEEKDKLIYRIKDNGAGFDMKYVDKLFGVFQRLHSEKDFEGTGIGLSLVKRIMHRHNGTIWAE